MRMNLFSLLAVTALSQFVGPATAQAPETRVIGLSGLSAPSRPWPTSVASTDTNSVHWFISSWRNCDPYMSTPWFEYEANEGPITKALGLLAPVAQENLGAALAINSGCNARPGCWCADPFRLDYSVDCQPASNGSGAGTPDYCQNGQYPLGNILGLPSAYSGPTAADVWCEAPWYAINWYGDNRPAAQFSVGGGVCFTTVIGSNGLAGHQNLNPSLGAGASVWLGCVTESGLEIRAGFSFFGSQQIVESRR